MVAQGSQKYKSRSCQAFLDSGKDWHRATSTTTFCCAKHIKGSAQIQQEGTIQGQKYQVTSFTGAIFGD